MLVGQQIGPFVVEEELGSGAMGSVYRASYTKTGLPVAIKIILPGMLESETAQARFERETAILKQLQHPNIVRLYATGRHKGTPFFAMEFIEGESLQDVLRRRGRLPWEELITLGQQLCAALQHAHDQGIVHRDLKPSNIMIQPDGTLKLTDFGIAKDLDNTGLTGTHCTVGTASYMSPEQCRGERTIGHKSDLYSLGVVLYQLLTGQLPFLADTPFAMFQEHLEGKFERPSRIVLDIPIWLDTLVCQLLEKKPERRPLDAAMVTQALERVMEKVSSHQSAGVDAVKGRRFDRPRPAHARDETDREAARTLHRALTREKEQPLPIQQRLWFRALMAFFILIALSATGGTIYLALKPPSADQLYAEAKRLLATGDPEDELKAQDGPLAKFLLHYPDDPRAPQVREWMETVEINQRLRQVETKVRVARRLGRDVRPESEVEDLACQAVRYEQFSDLERACERWQSLRRDIGPDSQHKIWAKLADRKLQELVPKVPADLDADQARELRKKLLEQKLTEAIQLTTKEPREARMLCDDIMALYSAQKEPELADLIGDARRLWLKLK